MTATEHPGEFLVQELLWIHGILRHDLEIVQRLATEVANGKSADLVHDEIAALKIKSPLWQLKVNCLTYCRLVHAHHNGEDAHVFPALRRSNPALGPVVDRLEADHRKVSEILDEVEGAAGDLTRDDRTDIRTRLIVALNLLAEHLLTHLAFEEESISPTLRSWRHWPMF